MSERKAVTRQMAVRYRSARKGDKAVILDELCALTGWHRDHARKALCAALGPKPVARQRKSRPSVYGPEVVEALRFCWAVMGGPAGKRMAPFLGELLTRLRACGELDNAAAALLDAGAPVAEVAYVLADRFGCSLRQARRYAERAAEGGRAAVPEETAVFTIRLPAALARRWSGCAMSSPG